MPEDLRKFLRAWSRDGRRLYAGGKFGNPLKVVRRWEDAGRGRYTDIKVSNNTIMQLLPLENGGTLFGTADPFFGLIDSQGRVKTLQGPGDLDFRARVLRLSRDGKTAEVSAINPSRTFVSTYRNARLTLIHLWIAPWQNQ